MNIFFLHKNPKKCAKYYSDTHVVKIILEITQLLTSAHILINKQKPYKNCYKLSHSHHPMSMWIRESRHNYYYALKIGIELCKEFRFRRNITHACEYHLIKLRGIGHPKRRHKINWRDKIRRQLYNCNYNITPIPMCMPEEYIRDCAISSYRCYYKSKDNINKWQWGRKKPNWYLNYGNMIQYQI